MPNSHSQLFKMVQERNVPGVVERIRCPTFVADPDNAQFPPGQSAEVMGA